MFKAHARIAFPEVERFFPVILEALEGHGLPVTREAPNRATAGEAGAVTLEIHHDRMDVSIRGETREALNARRYSVTSLIDFNAREASPHIVWEGDRAGDTRHPDLQALTVQATEAITPRLRRIWFAGDDLGRYDTLEQLHCRLFFGRGRGAPADWPRMTDQGRIRWPAGEARLDTRVYTIRHVDLAAGRLAVDFFLGDHDGPATRWARAAEEGDCVGFIGPAAHGLRPADFHVFAGDETGLPGVARCLEGLAPQARGVALIETAGPEEEQAIAAPSGVSVRWLHRDGAAPGTTRLLCDALAEVEWPEGLDRCAFWGGAERDAFLEMRRALRALGMPRERITAAAHWRRGMSETDIAAAGSNSIR